MKVLNLKEKTPKIAKVAKVVGDKIMRVDLFDGSKRGEVIARRVLFLITLFLALWILLDLLVDKGYLKTNGQREVRVATEVLAKEPVVALEQTEQPKVDNQTTGETEAPQKAPQPLKGNVEDFVASYGGRYDAQYLASLRQYCDEDTVKLVVAISVAETSMGKNTNRKTNWYGYFYKGNRSYDPSQDEMSKVICNGISKYYSDVATNYAKAKRYTGNDNTNTWMGNVQSALKQMQ